MPVLKRILFRTNIPRNSSAEYSAETDVAKLAHYSSYEEYSFFGRTFGFFAEYSAILPNIGPKLTSKLINLIIISL